jgi:nicotinamidase-related amidase
MPAYDPVPCGTGVCIAGHRRGGTVPHAMKENIIHAADSLLACDRAQLLITDMQERLLPAMQRHETVLQRTVALIETALELGVPVVVTEQYPKGLGPTVGEIGNRLGPQAQVFPKIDFSCVRDTAIAAGIDALAAKQRNQVVIAGIESHICILQSALDLRASGRDVYVVRDAVSSRNDGDYLAAIERMRQEGIRIVTTEMVLFEWVRRAGTPAFKNISNRVKPLAQPGIASRQPAFAIPNYSRTSC